MSPFGCCEQFVFIVSSMLFCLYHQLFSGGLLSYLRYLCLFAHIGVQPILCCVFIFFFVILCTLCCQSIWIFHFRLPPPPGYSLTFIYHSPAPRSTPEVFFWRRPRCFSFSSPFFAMCVLFCVLFPMLHVNLHCPYFIDPAVFSNVYLTFLSKTQLEEAKKID